MKRKYIYAVCVALLAVGFYTITHPDEEPLPKGIKPDRLVVEKSKHLMTLYSDGKPIKTYQVSLGRGDSGPKLYQGDDKTPEGIYHIKLHKARSDAHLAMLLDYPQPQDVQTAVSLGEKPGERIMIHGIHRGLGWLGTLHRQMDWTKGCIAVTNDEIDELWYAVPNGTVVEIKP